MVVHINAPKYAICNNNTEKKVNKMLNAGV
jgi:hypothetical protein